MNFSSTFSFFHKFYSLLRNFKSKVYFFFALSLLASLVEFLSLSSLIPVVEIIFDTNKFENVKNNFLLTTFNSGSSLNLFLIVIIFIFFLKFILFLFINKFSNNLVRDCSVYLTNQFFYNFINRNYLFHKERNSMDLVNIIQEVDSLCRVVLKSSLVLFTNFLLLLAVLVFLLNINFLLTLYLIFFLIIISLLIYLKFKNKLFNISKLIFENSKKKLIYLGDYFRSIKEIKIYNIEKLIFNNFNSVNFAHYNSAAQRDIIKSYPKILLEYIFILLVVFIIFILNEKHSSLEMAGFTLSFFLIASIRCVPLISNLISNTQVLKAKIYSLEVVFKENKEITKEKNLNDNNKIQDLEIKDFSLLQLKNISFNYGEKNIFYNINLDISKGDCLGIVGESGVGKSTLFDIISGLLRPTSGEIFLNNKLAVIFSNYFWFKKISYLSQNIYLNDDTIINNIVLSDNVKKRDDNLIQDLLIKLNLINLNKQRSIYDTIGESGSKLSGGQIQRIGLIRALYKKPSILILDEPTSSLDKKTETDVIEILTELKGKVTMIISSHKISTLKLCNKIFEIKKNGIIEIKKN